MFCLTKRMKCLSDLHWRLTSIFMDQMLSNDSKEASTEKMITLCSSLDSIPRS
jgi:hypothetical protein